MTQVSGNRMKGLRWSSAVLATHLALAGCSSDTSTSTVTVTTNASPPAADGMSTESLLMTPAAADAPDYAAGLETSLSAIVQKSTVPSAIVIVRSGQFGDVTFTHGATELGGAVPVSTTDHARVGSITKTMTATVILQLVQEGRIALDDPVSTYVPNVPNGDAITIAQLLDMRSGLYNYTDDPQWVLDSDGDPARVWPPQELIDVAFAHPANFAPGSNFQYSNTNYILLGLIMEQVTGQTAAELFEQRLFAPLGMQNTSLPAADDSTIPTPYLHGYHYGSFDKALSPEQQEQAAAGTLLPPDISSSNTSWAWTAGSVISTADDMVIWLDALVDGALLDPATQQLRLASIRDLGPDFPQAAGVYGYGYGMDRRLTYDGHGGQITGYNSAIGRDPATDTDIIVLTTLTLAPDGTSVANALLYAVIAALPNVDADSGR